MQKSYFNVNNKHLINNKLPINSICDQSLQTKFSTIQPEYQDIDSYQLIFQDQHTLFNNQKQPNKYGNQLYIQSNQLHLQSNTKEINQQMNLKSKQQNKINKKDNVHLQIQLDDGNVQIIYPQVNDNPEELARQFCNKHQLDNQMVELLTINIKNTINKLITNRNHQLYKSNQQSSRFHTSPNQINNKNRQSNNRSNNSKYNQSSEKKYLYHQILPKNINAFSTNNTNNTNKSSRTNNLSSSRNTNRQPTLYQRAIRQQSSRKHKLQKQKLLKQKQQLIQCTYTPHINPLSQKICNINPNYKSNKRLHQYQSVKTQASIDTEPFNIKPSKNQQYYKSIQSNKSIKSNKSIQSNNKQNHNVFDYLYQKRKVKTLQNQDQNLSYQNNKYYFKPKINQLSKQIVGNRSFVQRLNAKKNTQSKNSINKSVLSSKQKSIPSLPKNNPKVQVFYQHKKPNVSYSLKNITKAPSINNHLPSKPKITSSSKLFKKPIHNTQTQKLYENQKIRAFKQIFLILDQDQDGIISILNINLINGIQQKLIQVLFPVLQQLQILQTSLNQHEFCMAMEKLFVSLSIQQKDYLLKYCHKLLKQQKNKNTIQSFQTIMSSISSQLVNQTQRRNVTVYQYSKIKQQLKQQKLQQQRILKQKTLMRNCTFHPKINPKKNIYF